MRTIESKKAIEEQIAPPISYNTSYFRAEPSYVLIGNSIINQNYYETHPYYRNGSISYSGPAGCNLFVFHIPNSCFVKELFDLFRNCGDVVSCTVIVDPESCVSKGYGKIDFYY